MSKRIAIITTNNAENYGARLQCYALSSYIRSLGCDVVVIDYRPQYMDFKTKLLCWPGLSIKAWGKLILQIRTRQQDIKRHKKYVDFSRHYLPLSERIYRNVEDLRDGAPKADIYLAGSDQIWNTSFPNGWDSSFYLNFGDDKVQRFSYGASFGIKDLPNDALSYIRSELSRFDGLSFREDTGKKIVESMGYDVMHVCDPVLLLSPEHWAELCSSNEIANEKYILVYDQLGSKTIKRQTLELSKRHGYRIYSVGSRRMRYADKNYLSATPQEFLSLINNAMYLVTNSLHGCLFALIFSCRFQYIQREDGLNDRMDALMRMLCKDNDLEMYDISALSQYIEQSRQYLNKIIG